MKTKTPFLAVITAVWLMTLTNSLAFYDPNVQRWINRDPIGEKGGINLFGFVANRAISRIDYLGLDNPIMGPGGAVGPGSGLPDPTIFIPVIPATPIVTVQPIVGQQPGLMDIIAWNSGEIGQPAWAGKLTFTQFPSGYCSDISVSGLPWPFGIGGCCNTVTGPDGNPAGSGGLTFTLQAPPGRYQVDVQATLSLKGEGLLGAATGTIYEQHGNPILKSAGTTKKPYHGFTNISQLVDVGPSGASNFLFYEPSIGISDSKSSGQAIGCFQVNGVTAK